LVKKTDLYYILATIGIVCLFGAWVIPQVLSYLLYRGLPDWLIIIIVALVIPLFAVLLLWLIIQEIQQHFRNLPPPKPEKEESILTKEAFTPEEEKFIEEKMRTQLEAHTFKDEDNFERNYDLVLSYMRHSLKVTKTILLADIARELDLPLDSIKDLLLLLAADGLIHGELTEDSFKS
jgi:predicted PurR-regulated permease PerM